MTTKASKEHVVALALAALGITVAFAPLATTFRPFAAHSLKSICEQSEACSSAEITQQKDHGQPRWSLRVTPTPSATPEQTRLLRDAVSDAVLRSPGAATITIVKPAIQKPRS